jgi:hypothetical protein
MSRSIEQINTAIGVIDDCLRHETDLDAIDELRAEREELEAELRSVEECQATMQEREDDIMAFWDWTKELEWGEEANPYDDDPYDDGYLDYDDDPFYYDDDGFLH